MNYLWENIFKKHAGESDIARILKRNIFFSVLTRSEIKFIESLIHERSYKAGELIFRQGEAGVGMYIIVNGGVDILVEQEIKNEHSTKEQFVTHLGPDDFFGEISLVEENGRRTASAYASTDTNLIGFFKPDLSELLDRNPVIGVKVIYKLAEVLGRRLAETTDRISAIKYELQKMKIANRTKGKDAEQ